MKNKLNILIVFSVLIISVLGCSFYNPLSDSADSANSQTSQNKSWSDQAVDSTGGEEKIGIPECDEVIEFFADQSKSEDENFVTKAARGYAMSKIRESFRQSIEENKGDTAKMAKECREFKVQLDKYKPDGNVNKK